MSATSSSSSKPTGPERRRAPRAAAEIPIRLDALGSEGSGHLRDISTNGMRFSFSHPIPEMTLVKLGFEMAGAPVDLEGAVVRCERVPKGYDIAIFFTHVPGDHLRAIDRFVQQRLSAVAD
ncbi:MAG: PilZ domain-containing protein [Planctomycetota bacterium]